MKKIILFFCFLVFVIPGYAQTQGNLSSRVANAVLRNTTIQNVLKAAQANNLSALQKAVRFAGSSYLAVNVKDKNGLTPLMWACKNKNLEMVRFLLNQGARVNTEDNQKRVALEYALRSRQDQIAVTLIRANADVKRYVVLHLKGETLLQGSMFALAMLNGTTQAAREIYKQDKRFFGRRLYDGWTILDLAVMRHQWDMVEHFINEGYVGSEHSLIESFKARNFAVFKKLAYSSNIGGYSREWTLRTLVKSPDPKAFDYIKVLVKYIEDREHEILGAFMNFCPEREGISLPPLDIAVRKEVQKYLHDHWARSINEDFPPLPFENSLPYNLCGRHRATRYSSIWYQ